MEEITVQSGACKNQIRLCSVRKCEKCEYVGNEEKCPFSVHDSPDGLCPTFEDMLKIYDMNSASGISHKKSVIHAVRTDLLELGISVRSRASVMTRSKFKTLIQILTSPARLPTAGHPNGGPLCDDTVMAHLCAFRSISSSSLADAYESGGFSVPVFSIPKFEVKRRPVQEISDRTIRKVEILMEKWLSSGTESDRSAYILTFFALYCGMRLGDICELKWNVFRHTNDGLIVTYVPHKSITKKKPSGTPVSFRLENKTYCKIEPLAGNHDEFVIPRHDNRTGKHTRKNGMFCGKHVYLCKKVRLGLKNCGIGTEYDGQKTIHALRKYFETDMAFKYGSSAAANACGHTLRVQKDHYIGTLIGKVS